MRARRSLSGFPEPPNALSPPPLRGMSVASSRRLQKGFHPVLNPWCWDEMAKPPEEERMVLRRTFLHQGPVRG